MISQKQLCLLNKNKFRSFPLPVMMMASFSFCSDVLSWVGEIRMELQLSWLNKSYSPSMYASNHDVSVPWNCYLSYFLVCPHQCMSAAITVSNRLSTLINCYLAQQEVWKQDDSRSSMMLSKIQFSSSFPLCPSQCLSIVQPPSWSQIDSHSSRHPTEKQNKKQCLPPEEGILIHKFLF